MPQPHSHSEDPGLFKDGHLYIMLAAPISNIKRQNMSDRVLLDCYWGVKLKWCVESEGDEASGAILC